MCLGKVGNVNPAGMTISAQQSVRYTPHAGFVALFFGIRPLGSVAENTGNTFTNEST